jgi:pimeloyl-ACP methyl ester carboxylesterase
MAAGPSPESESLWLRAGGYRMHARVWGKPTISDAPVVLVHGLGVSSRYLAPTGRRLAEDYRVYAPDLPGFGQSERPRTTLTVEGLAEALIAWMDAAGLERAALLGNSLGCQVIVEAAVRYPRRVSQLVLVGPTIDPQARTALGQLFRLIQDVPYERLSLAAVVAWDYLTCGPFRLWRTLRAALQDGIEEKLPHLTQPTLIVRGEHDPLVPQRWAEEAANLLPHGQLIVIPDGAHAVNYSTPEALAGEVRKFLEENGERGA